MTNYRVCAIGNSHLAAAKLGWDQIGGSHPDFQFDFFGFAPGTSTEFESHTAVVGQSLVPTTSKLQRSFRLTAPDKAQINGADYSAFVTFGLGVGSPNALARGIGNKHRLVQHRDRDTYLISRACLAATAEDVVTSERALLPFKSLKRISDAPIFFHSTPASTVQILGDSSYAHYVTSVPGLLREQKPLLEDKLRAAGQPDIYTYIPQPEQTIDDSGLTKDEFITDGVGFSGFRGRSKAWNVGHGNAKYGAIAMENLIAILRNSASALRPI